MSPENQLMLQVFWQVLCFSLVYNVIEGLRHLVRHRKTIIWLEDMLYWVSVTYRMFCTLQDYGDGTIRWYLVLCAAAAVVIYKCGIQKYPIAWFKHLTKRLFHTINKRNT